MKFAVYYGVGQGESRLEDDLFKIKVMEKLPKNWEIALFSRLKKAERLAPENAQFRYMYAQEDFDGPESDAAVEDAERWLGYPIGMMLRQDKVISGIRDSAKLRYHAGIAAKYIRAWRKVFDGHGTELFCSSFECGLCERAGELVARRMGIPTMIMSVARVGRGFAFYDGDFRPFYWKKSGAKERDELYSLYVQVLEKRAGVEFQQIRKTVGKSMEITPEKVRGYLDFIGDYGKMKEYERTRYRDPASAAARYMKMKLRKVSAKMKYKEADFENKYFFYPLQYEDEAQQLVRDPFLNQFELIERLSSLMPIGVEIYVKPHPHYQAAEASGTGLARVARLPNVRIVHHDTNTVELIKNSLGLMTINSTMGFEALALGKPVIAFGHDWYAREGISVVVRDMQDLAGKIVDIANNPDKYVDMERVKDFVGGYLAQVIPAGTIKDYHVELTDGEANLVADELVKFVESGAYRKKAGFE